jgi:acyl carrier protein
MPDRDRVMQVLSKAIDELNQQLPADERITPSPGTRLFGDGGSLDSLSLIHLVVLTEELAQREFGREVLLSPHLESEEENPFATVETLAGLLSDELAR